MKKRIIVLALVMLFGFFLASCEKTPTLTSIVISGADDETLAFEAEFNILEGVTAIGDDGVDYTANMTYIVTPHAALTGDMLDTAQTGNHAIRYTVTVEGIEDTITWRYITVNPPQAVEGEMLVNPDFSNGTAGWNDSSVNYVADGASMDISVVDEEFMVVVVAGSNVWTPRFGQMNVPFENGKTYEITFEARSSVNKVINLQVGEVLAGAPYWDDFKPNITIHQEITTVMTEYSYKFTMNEPEENTRGGILFELGTIDGVAVDATMYFDNIAIAESTPDVDVTAPVFSGVMESVNVLVNGAYDPTAGVTAFDVTDGDVTDEIVVTIEDSQGNAVLAVDTSAEGTYVVTYTVEDSLGNSDFTTTTVNVVGLLFSETNLITNPSFAAAFDETTPEWSVYSSGFAVTPTLDTTAGTYALDISGTGSNVYDVQLSQDGYLSLELGKTYRLQFTVSSTVDRDLNVTLGYALTSDPWYVDYARQNGIAITTTEETYTFLFTVEKPSHDVKLVFELGNTPGYAASVVTFSEVKLQELDVEPIIMNSDFSDIGWDMWAQFWGDAPTVTVDTLNDMFNISIDKPGEAFWAVQFNQDGIVLEAATTYTLTFDAKASVARDINLELLGSPLAGDAKSLFVLTTEMQTFSVDVTTVDAVANAKLSFELGATPTFAAGTVSINNVSIVEKDVVDAPELIINGDTLTVVGGHTYDNAGGGAGSMLPSADGAVITVETLGAAYQPHYYYIIDELLAGSYTATFTMSSSVARDFRFNLVLPNSDYASILPDTKYDFNLNADETTTITVNFTVETMLTNIKVELDFGTLGDAPLVSLPGTFTLYEMIIYPNFN